MNSRRSFLNTLAGLAALPALSRTASAQSAASSGMAGAAADRARQLIISYNEDYAPYSFSESGRVEGILPEVLEHLLANVPDLKVSRVAYPWRRAQLVVQNEEADAICTFASEERRRYADFHFTPITVLRPALFYAETNPRRADIEKISSVEQLKKIMLIDQKGNQWAEQTLAGYTDVQWVGDHDTIFRMVLSGRADAHVSLSPIVTRWRLKKLGITQGVVSRPAPYVAAEVPFHLGIRKTHPRAKTILAAIDRQLARRETQAFIEKVTARFF